MKKKAQGQIITTILIILLVLAAVVIVWQVVNRTVQTGAKEVTAQSDCLGITLEIESALAGEDITIRRGTGGPDEIDVYSIVEGETKVENDANLAELDVVSFAIGTGGVVNAEIKAGAILSDGTLCSPIASAKIVAP
jgi:hypothetical protein